MLLCDPVELEQLDRVIANGLARKHWPIRVRQHFNLDLKLRAARETRFICGLLMVLCSLGLNEDAKLGIFELGLKLRLGIVFPLFLVAIVLAGRVPAKVNGLLLSIPILAFAAFGTLLGQHAPPLLADRYVLATAILIGTSVMVLPLVMRSLAAFAVLGFTAIVAVTWVFHDPAQPHYDGLLTLIAMVCFAPLILAARTNRLRERNYLLSLRSRLAQTSLLDANDALRRLADSDPLTGLANRRKFERLFDQAFDTALGCGEPIAVLMMDIDHFKTFNDSHGHPAGDRCIREVAATIARAARRDRSIVARYGGEEFVTVLSGASAASALSLSEKIRRRVAALNLEVSPGVHQQVTISIGLMIAKPTVFARNELIRLADQALYAAKQAGRDRVVLQSAKRSANPVSHGRRSTDRKVA